MTVAGLERELGSAELTEWIEFDKEEPIGELRAAWPMAILACNWFNAHRKAGTAAAQPKDFLWGAKDESKQRQTKQTFAFLDSIAVDKKDGSDKT